MFNANSQIVQNISNGVIKNSNPGDTGASGEFGNQR